MMVGGEELGELAGSLARCATCRDLSRVLASIEKEKYSCCQDAPPRMGLHPHAKTSA